MKKKFYLQDGYMIQKEFKSLKQIKLCNYYKVKKVIGKNDELFFVLKYIEYKLYYSFMNKDKPFLKQKVKSGDLKKLQLLKNMYTLGYFYRDLKLKNLLVTKDIIRDFDYQSRIYLCRSLNQL